MLFAIGDVHGCANELRRLLNELPLTPQTTVVFLGDLIDRGPDSKGVVDTVLELRKHCKVVAIMGNHEDLLHGFLEDPGSRKGGLFILNGGSATLQSYAVGNGRWRIPREHLEFFASMPLSYQTEYDYFVHAGVPDMPLAEIDPLEHRHALLWTRRPFLESDYRWDKMIVHGHTVVQDVEIHENRINMDTGCVFSNRLSAIALPGHRVISVERDEHEQEERVVLRDDGGTRGAVRFQGTLRVRVRARDHVFEFETVDYSEFGMYMRSAPGRLDPGLRVGEVIHGVIDPDDPAGLEFSGEIVRAWTSNKLSNYAVSFNHLEWGDL